MKLCGGTALNFPDSLRLLVGTTGTWIRNGNFFQPTRTRTGKSYNVILWSDINSYWIWNRELEREL